MLVQPCFAAVRRSRARAVLAAAAMVVAASVGAQDKNAEADVIALGMPSAPVMSIEAPREVEALPAQYLSCAAEASGFQSASPAASEVIACSINAPVDGVLLAYGSASVSYNDGEYELRAAITVDNPTFDTFGDRWLNIYADAGDGTDKSLALNRYKAVTAGLHTVRFLASRFVGPGSINLFDPQLAVVFVPAPLAQQTTCGITSGGVVSLGVDASIVTCSIPVAAAGTAFVSASASVGYGTAASEALMALALDGEPMLATQRWVNTYPDSGDGTDESIATQYAFDVGVGTRTFAVRASRFSGTGTPRLYDTAINVIVVPTTAGLFCQSQGNLIYTSASNTFSAARTCSLSLAQPARAMMFGSASMSFSNQPYEANFRLAIDDLAGLAPTDRWVNVDTDSGDGTDRTMAVNATRDVGAGTRQFNLVGRRFSGAGTARAFNAGLAVLLLQSDRIFKTGFEP